MLILFYWELVRFTCMFLYFLLKCWLTRKIILSLETKQKQSFFNLYVLFYKWLQKILGWCQKIIIIIYCWLLLYTANCFLWLILLHIPVECVTCVISSLWMKITDIRHHNDKIRNGKFPVQVFFSSAFFTSLVIQA